MERDHVDELAAQWARRRPDLDTSALQIAARVMRLQRFLERAAVEHLEPYGLHQGEVNVLAALRRAEPPHELTPTELYRALLLSSGAMTHRVDRLEQAGLVVRRRDVDDRRKVLVRLTERGRHVVDEAMDTHVAGLAELFSVLDDTETADLEDRLRRLLARIEADRDAP